MLKPTTNEGSQNTEIPFYKIRCVSLIGNNISLIPKVSKTMWPLVAILLAKSLSQMTPEQVVEKSRKSNLREGGGFPMEKVGECAMLKGRSNM